VGLFALHIYLIVEEANHFSAGYLRGVATAANIRVMAFEVGSLLGFASIVYLLAPRPVEMGDEPELEPAD
jgi:hypothetical protein